MWDWLSAPIDAARAHDVGPLVSWHARAMVLAWAVLAPLAVIVARFFKIVPGQNWPEELDHKFWWRSHWIGQSLVFLLSVLGLLTILPAERSGAGLHGVLGYALLLGLLFQVIFGLGRGNKGGPTAPGRDGSTRGHHYDMTPWRRGFEMLHKSLGYGLLLLAAATILMGLWTVNAPRWMWITLPIWWLALVIGFVWLQRRGFAVDTYQAIWGDSPAHPGNQRPAPGWGVRRPGDGRHGGAKTRDITKTP